MALKPEISLGVAGATGAIVLGVYALHMPQLAHVKNSPANNGPVESSRKIATWTAAGIVGAVSLVAHDPTVFVLGGLMVIALDFAFRHANAQDHMTGQVIPSTSDQASTAQ